ncbi:hypothetical protein BHE74_00013588 [Ensete ventricosum]|uniref:Uncharacterized protein n=1 Tax=Ensete ventricosum TaxID=4639 RepID=A0A444EER6_ENSVE|nr:hypothetical protein B296_00025775 [Ensete ventricosum]RWW08863.1 hypothetical protein GW17_00027675 [Ensete ventricosum]RWW78203.1 hypothetical protein BHE74_00013588 [Ensete ventricosum]
MKVLESESDRHRKKSKWTVTMTSPRGFTKWTVSECHVIVDPRTRESRGFGFVTMETVEGAERCVKYLNRSVLEGRLITVEKVA